MDQRQTTGRILTRQPEACGNSQNRAGITGGTKVGLNQMWSFKKPKINPSQWQRALRGEQRSKAKCLYKMFIFGGLCGLVFGRALTPNRPTIELETAGRRQEVGRCLPYPCTPQTGACSAFKVGQQLVMFLPPAYPENSCDFCGTGPSAPPGPTPSTCQHTYSVSKKHCRAQPHLPG